MEASLMTAIHEVAPSQIAEELTKMWDAMEGAGKMRACLFNLIFFCPNNQRIPYLRTIAQKVIEKFPSRVLFVTTEKGEGKNYLKTRVSTMVSSLGTCEIACDLIQVDVGGPSLLRLPSVILPHLLPDLPIYLIWGEDPSDENPITHLLMQLPVRSIFDSETTDNLPRFAKTLLDLRARLHMEIADLNWARMESWRDLLSTTFYSDKRLAELRKAHTITIGYQAKASPFFCHTKTQSLYLQAWLACQLDWKLKEFSPETDSWRFLYARPDGQVVINLVPSESPNLTSGTIISMEISTEEGGHFSFSRNADHPHQVRMRISSSEACELPSNYIFAKAESGQSLVKEVCHKGSSSHYLKVLEQIQEMQALALC